MDEKLDLAWLGGIVDGEGSIGVFLHVQVKDGKRTQTWRPSIQITNTNPIIIARSTSILERHGATFTAHVRTRVNPNWKDTTDIAITGLRRCAKAISVLRPYVYAKAHNLTLLDRLVQSRLSALTGPRQPRKGGGSHNPSFTDEELQLVADLQKANKLGPPVRAEEIV